jgi:hypothetical protein
MIRKLLPISIALTLLLAGCAMMQSIVKSTFPYTTTLTIPQGSAPGDELTATGMATSYDQNFSKSGDDGDRVSDVRIISAKLRATDPSDFNIGNIISVRFYMSMPDGSDEVLVASRGDITPMVGNSIVLDIDNSSFLDKLVRMPNVKIRMVYKLRSKVNVDANLRLVLGLSAYPNNN